MYPLYVFAVLLLYIPVKLIFPTKKLGNKKTAKNRMLFACNHYRKSDVLVLAASANRSLHFMAKKEWFDNKFLKWLFNALGVFPVSRGNADLSAIKKAISFLNKEKAIALFPEGTRNTTDGDMLALKNGIGSIAIRGKSPITPMVFYRPPMPFRRNFMLYGETFDLSQFYNEPTTKDVLNSCGQILTEKMTALKAEVDEYVATKYPRLHKSEQKRREKEVLKLQAKRKAKEEKSKKEQEA